MKKKHKLEKQNYWMYLSESLQASIEGWILINLPSYWIRTIMWTTYICHLLRARPHIPIPSHEDLWIQLSDSCHHKEPPPPSPPPPPPFRPVGSFWTRRFAHQLILFRTRERGCCCDRIWVEGEGGQAVANRHHHGVAVCKLPACAHSREHLFYAPRAGTASAPGATEFSITYNMRVVGRVGPSVQTHTNTGIHTAQQPSRAREEKKTRKWQ